MSVTPEPIMKIAMGFMAAKYLLAATEIGVFDALARGPASLRELATSTGTPSRTLSIVAAAMVSLGLLEQDGSRYRNSETAEAFLADIPGHPDLRPILRYFDEIVYPKWEKFAEAIRTDHGQPQFSKFTTHQQQMFSAAVEAFSAPGAVALAGSQRLANEPERSRIDVVEGDVCQRPASWRSRRGPNRERRPCFLGGT